MDIMMYRHENIYALTWTPPTETESQAHMLKKHKKGCRDGRLHITYVYIFLLVYII